MLVTILSMSQTLTHSIFETMPWVSTVAVLILHVKYPKKLSELPQVSCAPSQWAQPELKYRQCASKSPSLVPMGAFRYGIYILMKEQHTEQVGHCLRATWSPRSKCEQCHIETPGFYLKWTIVNMGMTGRYLNNTKNALQSSGVWDIKWLDWTKSK